MGGQSVVVSSNPILLLTCVTYRKYTAYVAYNIHRARPLCWFPQGPRGHSEEPSHDRFTVRGRQTPRCPDFGSLLLKHGSQAFRHQYARVSQSIPSLTTPACASVLSGYTDGVFGQGLILPSRHPREGVRSSGPTVAAIVYHAPQALAPLKAYGSPVSRYLQRSLSCRPTMSCRDVRMLHSQHSPIILY